VTIIEITPFRNGWRCFEAPGVEPVFLDQAQAIDYATGRACFRSGEIRILNSTGKLERTIAFSEVDRGRLLSVRAEYEASTPSRNQPRQFTSRSHDAVIRVYDDAGNVIERTNTRAISENRER
jgi:hypothetical protein